MPVTPVTLARLVIPHVCQTIVDLSIIFASAEACHAINIELFLASISRASTLNNDDVWARALAPKSANGALTDGRLPTGLCASLPRIREPSLEMSYTVVASKSGARERTHSAHERTQVDA